MPNIIKPTELYERRFVTSAEPELVVTVASGEKPMISGMGAVFGQYGDLGMFVEIVEPGFFDSVMDADVRSLFNHDPDDILGRAINGTLRFSQTDIGLAYETDINPDDEDAMSVYQKIKRGDVTGSSIMFCVKSLDCGDDMNGDEWYVLGDKVIRRLLKNGCKELLDIGPVTFPVYEQTSASARSKATDMRNTMNTSNARQEPGEEEARKLAQAQARRRSRERMLMVAERSLFILEGEKTMKVRELMSKRAELVQSARAMTVKADTEERDFSAEERSEFERVMGEVDSITVQITTITDERNRLMNAEKTLTGTPGQAEKPATSASKLMKRADFEKLSHAERAAFMRSGGQTED